MELRAGKNELKNFQIVTLEDFETRIPTLKNGLTTSNTKKIAKFSPQHYEWLD